MPSLRTVVLGSLFVLAPLGRAYADPLDAKQVPVDAKWVMHLDFDAMQASKTWGMVNQQIAKDPQAQACINEVQIISGMKFPQDMHDLTLYGQSYTPDTGVVVAHVATDQTKIINLLKLDPGYSTSIYGAYEIHSWQDDGKHGLRHHRHGPLAEGAANAPAAAKPKQMYGAYHGAAVMVVSSSLKDVQAALDMLDGKGATLKADSILLAGVKKGDLVYMAGDDLATIKDEKLVQSPVLAQAESGSLSCREQDDNIVLHASIMVADAKAAEDMKTTLEGLRALVSLASQSGSTTQGAEPLDPKAKMAKLGAQSLLKLKIELTNKTLSVDWPISLDLIREGIENIKKEQDKEEEEHDGPADTAPAKVPAVQ